MSLQTLKPKTSNKKSKRVGRGNGSGHGTYSTRGMKGQSARTGGKRRPGFEGGQMPYLQKLPKMRGFKNPNYVDYQVVNVGELNVFENGATVDVKSLKEKGLVSKTSMPVKLLGGKGTLDVQLNITVDKASKSAIQAVEAKSGKVELKKAKSPKAETEK